MAFIRKIKRGNTVYLAKVENYREEGKVKQRVLEYVGKEDGGQAVQNLDINRLEVENVQHYADIKILYQLATELKLNYLLGAHHKPILALLIAHLVSKAGIVRMGRWIESSALKEIIGATDLSTATLYTSLDHLEACPFEKIEEAISAYWVRLAPNDNKVFVLDVTDTYHNGSQNPSALRKGKDGKVSKLVQIGLGVSFENGFPIFHKTYGGNISNIKILEDLMRVMAQRGISTIIMDRGFYSQANVQDLHKLKMKMIVGLKQSVGIRQTVLSKIKRDEIYSSANQVKLKDTFVYVQESTFLFGRLIIIYNPKYEALKRDKLLSEQATDEQVKYVGYSLVFHNTKMKAGQVVVKYFEKDIIERSFRTMKGDVQLHPIRLWLPGRVNAHVKLCYLAMCILSLIKFRCSHILNSPIDVINELQSIYKVNLKHLKTNSKFTKVVTLSNQQKLILKALKCSV